MTRKGLMACCVAGAVLAATQASYAVIDADAFLGDRNSLVDNSPIAGYSVGDLLSADWGAGGTSGALTIQAIAGPAANTSSDPGHSAANNLAVRVDTGTTTKAATYNGWGGPGRSTSPQPETNRVYFSIDVFKGTGSFAGTLWSVGFVSGSGKEMLKLQGTLTGVQMLVENGTASVLYTGPLKTLQNGWNNICVVSDTDLSPDGNPDGNDVNMYMNTNFNMATLQPLSPAVDSYNAILGPIQSGSAVATGSVTMTRFNSTAGTGSMYIDNVLTADTLTDLVQADQDYFGWETEAASYGSVPEPATLFLLAGVLPLLRQRRTA